MSPASIETEIKLPVRNRRIVLARIRRAGFWLRHARTFEANILLDTTQASLRGAGALLRLRQFGESAVITYKGPGTAAKHKSREEIETQVSDLGRLQQIMERLGFAPAFRYEKYRLEFEDGTGVATMD